MIINPDIMRRDTVQLLKQIDVQIKEVEEAARRSNVPPSKLRDTNGNWVINPLLLAKVQAYATLVQLQSMK
jgi:hypothetical protein